MLTHDNFYNRTRSGYDELTSYLPLFWKEILEMRANNKFAGYTLDRMAGDLEQLILDEFWDSCSNECIVRAEKFLELTGNEGKDWEERRSAVKLKWLGGMKMNRTRIKSIVKSYCDCDCQVMLTDSQLIVDMVFKDDPALYMDNIRNFLNNSTIPAHIEVVYHGMMDFSIISVIHEKMLIPRIINKMKFSLYHASGYLDGKSFLNGSGSLNDKYNWFQTSTSNMLSFALQEALSSKSVIPIENAVKSCYEEIASLQTEHSSEEQFTHGAELDFSFEAKEDWQVSVTIKKNLSCLDGNQLLDGSETINSYIKKEEL